MLGANQKESFNSPIWNRCPKTEFATLVVVEIAVDMASSISNAGQRALKGALQQLKCGPCPMILKFRDSKEETRIWKEAEYKRKELVKKRRQLMRQVRVTYTRSRIG